MKISLSTIREVREIVGDDWREAVENMRDEDEDFECGGYRFIADEAIDRILEEELESDAYVLGCFNAGFLAEASGWPKVLIEAAQKGDAYEALGKALIDEGKVTEIATAYAQADGYGHHFATYDGEELSVTGYYVFRRD